MKRTSRSTWLIAALTLLTAALAMAYLATRDTAPIGTVRIESPGKTADIALSQLELSSIKGSILNGKGEEKVIETQGLPMSQLLQQNRFEGFSSVTVTADDAYSAAVTAEEIASPGRIYLTLQEDDGIRLLVFGDADSKRQVSNVVKLYVQ